MRGLTEPPSGQVRLPIRAAETPSGIVRHNDRYDLQFDKIRNLGCLAQTCRLNNIKGDHESGVLGQKWGLAALLVRLF